MGGLAESPQATCDFPLKKNELRGCAVIPEISPYLGIRQQNISILCSSEISSILQFLIWAWNMCLV